ncbi:histidine phosphatase family protein [Ruania suaedae]|uniref:histidine phosphatase family protein n=1 Tax=Ruania suaedae TaxID=2897774 RepID=UPI001E2A63F3|nr:histidine phosphatase family protein [Ruania suaedae]UFU01678.1 histidine phosphatase family protein [Ruania suaedae]
MSGPSGTAVDVVLVRHGETPLTPHGAYSGSGVPGPSLTMTGREQAHAAARLVSRIGTDLFADLAAPSVLLTSPMVRTQETAAVLSEALGLPAQIEARARECDFGDWEGLRPEEIDARWPGERAAWHTDGTIAAPGGGESTADVGVRTEALLADLHREHAGTTVVVVAHAVSIRAMVGSSLLAPLGGWWRFRLLPASTTVLRRYADSFTQVLGVGLPGQD